MLQVFRYDELVCFVCLFLSRSTAWTENEIYRTLSLQIRKAIHVYIYPLSRKNQRCMCICLERERFGWMVDPCRIERQLCWVGFL